MSKQSVEAGQSHWLHGETAPRPTSQTFSQLHLLSLLVNCLDSIRAKAWVQKTHAMSKITPLTQPRPCPAGGRTGAGTWPPQFCSVRSFWTNSSATGCPAPATRRPKHRLSLAHTAPKLAGYTCVSHAENYDLGRSWTWGIPLLAARTNLRGIRARSATRSPASAQGPGILNSIANVDRVGASIFHGYATPASPTALTRPFLQYRPAQRSAVIEPTGGLCPSHHSEESSLCF